jgi:hypothetical protein
MINTVVSGPGSVTATGVICQLGVEDCQLPVGGVAAESSLVLLPAKSATILRLFRPRGSSLVLDLTAPGTCQGRRAVKAVRLRCSAFTSGTIVGGLGAFVGTV